ncbi:MAG: ribbon-helix-helix domain-containing protein [Nanoarchaeota archaeon]|nr:ribbon-helix-helix domain-containing protein [Nanoarchaeota archaeon]
MALKQISMSMPENLLKASKEYSEEHGYRSIQEFMVELLRNKVMMENIQRYKEIERNMAKGKSVKKLSQKDAVSYLKNL